jgi:hypothetical protein
MPPVEFEPTIPMFKRPKPFGALDCEAIGIK